MPDWCNTWNRRRPAQAVCWASVLLVLFGLTVTPGVRHGEVEATPVVAETVAVVEPEDPEGVVVYRRERPSRTPVGTMTSRSTVVETAHHETGSSGDARFVHTHDGRNPHVHYSVLGLDVTLPVAPERGRDTTLVADVVDDSPATGAVEEESKAPLVPTVERPASRTGSGELVAFGGGYLNPARVVLPASAPGEAFTAELVWPTSPLLDGDAPVPRPPRV